MCFGQFFHTATGHPQPYPYQAALAQSADWPELLDVPTGLGKTGAVTLAWLYKRGWRKDGRSGVTDVNTPRRLLWCLPMRVLVEQTQRNISTWLEALNIHGEAGEEKVSVHLLMGGEADLKTWAEHPEEDMILIGTQDMLLSRALMRGYGMSRYQWPVHFALLHNDCLWAYDEVQLMGAGMATSAQLEAFRRDFPLGRGSRSLWLSATLNPKWLATVDLKAHLADFSTHALTPADRERASERLHARKSLFKAGFSLDGGAGNKAGLKAYLEVLRDAVLEAHEPAGQTLLILNRVERAQGLFQALQQARPDSADLLIHARFRPPERRRIESELAHGEATDRIIVATQAIEAGVDMSAKVLFTELAPWSSLVQRFGRCNRYGEHNPAGGARIFWIDITPDAESLPYEHPALDAARALLESLTEAGPTHLPPPDQPRPLTPVLRRKDLLELFNTDADLSGFDVDIADYIRDTDNPGLQVFWRDIADPNAPQQQPPPGRDELCPVSIGQVKSLLDKRDKRDAWRWNALAGRWEKLRAAPRPGMVLLLAAQDGGYDPALGFVADSKQAVTPLATPTPEGQERYDADWRSRTARPVLLTEHLAHAATQAAALCQALDERAFSDDIIRASRWHDVGKAHQVFNKTMHSCEGVPAGLLAKSPCQGRHERPGFRHELASALAWLAQQDVCGGYDHRVNRIAYLIAAHHGKVRMSLRAMPSEKAPADGRRFARGIREGDVLPAVTFDTEASRETELSLALMELGEGEQGLSWTARTLALLEQHGPFQLAWLESLVRIADWRASVQEQEVNGDAR
ncbi:MAG: CRISPR-associated helicase Cas3' [Gammaproteobacteria bacterium]|nr:CRISPR-associated helicase Cas3' [Gammaproteobacteria bacterium]